jgi:RNA:NAD 2'-phosphotransferase (TPT1/KptA family)
MTLTRLSAPSRFSLEINSSGWAELLVQQLLLGLQELDQHAGALGRVVDFDDEEQVVNDSEDPPRAVGHTP